MFLNLKQKAYMYSCLQLLPLIILSHPSLHGAAAHSLSSLNTLFHCIIPQLYIPALMDIWFETITKSDFLNISPDPLSF